MFLCDQFCFYDCSDEMKKICYSKNSQPNEHTKNFSFTSLEGGVGGRDERESIGRKIAQYMTRKTMEIIRCLVLNLSYGIGI